MQKQEELKKLKAYLIFKNSAGGVMMTLAVLIWLGMLAGMIYGLLDWEHSGVMVAAGGVGVLIFGVLLYKSLLGPRIQSAMQTRQWTAGGEIDAIIEDFVNAHATRGLDIARLGQTYVFGRKTGAPVKYADIVSVKLVRINTNGMVLETDLIACLRSGKSAVVCKIPRSFGHPVELEEVIAAIRSHQPDFRMEK